MRTSFVTAEVHPQKGEGGEWRTTQREHKGCRRPAFVAGW